MIDDTRSSRALIEREQIRRSLLRQRPALGTRLATGASGALVIPVCAQRSVEIGRMRRCGLARWVVIEPMAEGARVHEPASLEDCVRIALAALRRWRLGMAAPAGPRRNG